MPGRRQIPSPLWRPAHVPGLVGKRLKRMNRIATTTSALVELLAEGLQVATHDLAVQLQNHLDIRTPCLRAATTCRTRQASSRGSELRRRPASAAKGPPRDVLKPAASAGGAPRLGTLCISKSYCHQRRGRTEAISLQSTRAEGRRRRIQNLAQFEDFLVCRGNVDRHPTRASIPGSSVEQSLAMALVQV